MLKPRNCTLDLESHRYFWDPDGARIPMRVSVTGVTNWGKDKSVYDAYPDAAPRGTHVHRAMEALARDNMDAQSIKRRLAAGEIEAGSCPPENLLQLLDNDGHISPEGIDCGDWIHQLRHGQISPGLTMDDFWKDAEVITTEFTMVSQKRSLGGQLDLLVKFRGEVWLVDLKTKSASYISSSKDDRDGYAAQAGGYLWLMDEGDGAKDERPPYVEKCRTLIVTPKKVDWLTAMDPTDCAMQWEEAWGAYSAASLVCF